MNQDEYTPGYPGLGPRFGAIHGVWYIREGEELVAIVEEGSLHGHRWMLYHWVGGEWVNMGAFASAGRLIAHAAPLFAEVLDVAIPVDPVQAVQLVVEEGPDFRWWVVHGTALGWRRPIVAFAAPKLAFVVPI